MRSLVCKGQTGWMKRGLCEGDFRAGGAGGGDAWGKELRDHVREPLNFRVRGEDCVLKQ